MGHPWGPKTDEHAQNHGMACLKNLGRVFCRKKKPLWERQKATKSLENIKIWKSEDTRSFSGLYATVLSNSCGNFEGIAARSGLEGSQTPKNKNHALNQVGMSCLARQDMSCLSRQDKSCLARQDMSFLARQGIKTWPGTWPGTWKGT